MRYLIALMVTLAWGLWLGGQVTLAILISTLFARDRAIATSAGPHLFHVFERYQLGLAIVAVLAAAGWLGWERKRMIALLLGAFIIAALGSVASFASITPRMEAIIREGKSGGPEWAALHERSRECYTVGIGALTLAGLMLPLALKDPKITVHPETVEAKAAA